MQRAAQQCERGSHERGGSATHVRTTRVEGASRPMVVDSLNDVVAMMKQLRNSAHVDDYEDDYDMPGENLPAALPAVAVTDASVSSEALAAAPGPATFLALSTSLRAVARVSVGGFQCRWRLRLAELCGSANLNQHRVQLHCQLIELFSREGKYHCDCVWFQSQSRCNRPCLAPSTLTSAAVATVLCQTASAGWPQR